MKNILKRLYEFLTDYDDDWENIYDDDDDYWDDEEYE